MPDFGMLIDLADKLGLIQTVKDKLLRQPGEAADKLVAVLEEVSKVFTTIEGELVRYLSLNFDPEAGLSEERAALLTLEGGQLRIRVEEARAHCHKIDNIYRKHLDRWFHRVLSSDEARAMVDLFERLSNADIMMIGVFEKVTDWLTQEALETLNLVDAKAYDQANVRVISAHKEILPVRQAITNSLVTLRRLQADFILLSQTT